jgi:archaeal flagellar protein FlaJ
MPDLKEDLLKSNLRVTPVGLISVAFFLTVVSAAVSLGVVLWAAGTPFTFLYLVGVSPIVVFLLVLNAPKVSQSGRAAALENELPFVVGYMSILAGGGLTLIDTLRQISEIEIFPAASKEARRILIDIDMFGHDPLTALERASRQSASRAWEELLAGYTTVLRTGGDYVNYLNLHLRESFDAMSDKLKRTVDTVGLIAESFLIVTVVLGLTLFTLYLVEALVNSNQSGINNIYFFNYLIVPLISAGFIWLIDAVAPKWPYTDRRPYMLFLVLIPVGLGLFVLPLPIKLYWHMGISLIAITAPPAYFATKYSRERRSIEKKLPDFIDDVSEGRKIGLPPEEAIERLGETITYGALSKPVQKMAAQLSWGISLKKVISNFSDNINSWVAKAVGTLMLQVVEIGGGTINGFEDMASFTRKVSDVEAQGRSQLRSYVLIAYIGGLMLIMTTFIMVILLAQGSALGVKGISLSVNAASAGTLDALVAAGMFESWVIGLTAGKMGEGSVSEGFKHGLILVLMNLAAIVIVGPFIKFPI